MVLDKEVSAETAMLLIEYCYTGHVKVTNENSYHLLYAANLYKFKALKNICIDFLEAQINNNNALHVWLMAQVHDSSRLLQAASAVVRDAFMQLINTAAFQMLSVEQLFEWVNGDDIHVGSEEDVFHIIVQWIRGQPEARTKHYGKLLGAVRLAGISSEVLHVLLLCLENK